MAKAKKGSAKRGAPLGNRNGQKSWFSLGVDHRRVVTHGLPKVFQRAKAMALEQLMEEAPPLVCEVLGMPHGSSWNDLRIRALILAACGLHSVDIAAQRELREVTEGIRRQVEMNVVHGLNTDQLERARKQILQEMTIGLPAPKETEE